MTQTCFVFSSYTSLFQFGMCREWVDVEPGLLQDTGRLSPSMRGDLGHNHLADAIVGTGKSLASLNNTRSGGGGGTGGGASSARCKAAKMSKARE